MKNIIKFFIIFSLLAPFVNAAEYSFEQAYERALIQDEELLASQKEVERFKASKNASRGLYLPKVSVEGRYTYIDEPITINLDPIRSAINPLYNFHIPGYTLPAFELEVQDDKFFKSQITASLPLYTGGKVSAANKASSANLEEALAKLEQRQNNILTELTTKYFGAILAKEAVKIRAEFLKNTKQNAKEAAQMYKAGTISKVEKMAIEITAAQAQRDYDTSLNDADMAQTLLKNLLSEQEDISFTSSLFMPDQSKIPTLDYFKQRALQNNTSLKIIDAGIKKTKANIKAQRADFLPTIYLFAKHELYTKDLTILEPDYAYGIGFSWNLFEGGASYNKTKAAIRQKESVEELKQKAVQDIQTALDYYYKKMQNAAMNYKAVQKEITFSKEFYRARKIGFKAGTSTSLEVNTALTYKLKTQLDSIKAEYDFLVSLATLLSLSGDTNTFESYK
ncbi:MAG: TolC family protein [Elusimicrobiaceae bacterium]|nr:TolC family protein [Elusimicrobiaceae bacterium]